MLRCDDRPNIAVGHVPWGPSAVLAGRTDHVAASDLARYRVDEIASAATVVLVTRDRHRHPWMVRTLDAVRADRPDAVLLEMGTTGVRGAQAPAVGSYGATLANTRAALRRAGRAGHRDPGQRDTMTAMEPHQLLDHGGSGAPSQRSADSPRLLREINDQVVLGLLLERGPMTRGRIGEATGLSKPTVSVAARPAGGTRSGDHRRCGRRRTGTQRADLHRRSGGRARDRGPRGAGRQRRRAGQSHRRGDRHPRGPDTGPQVVLAAHRGHRGRRRGARDRRAGPFGGAPGADRHPRRDRPGHRKPAPRPASARVGVARAGRAAVGDPRHAGPSRQ